jgi:hypothetical protein
MADNSSVTTTFPDEPIDRLVAPLTRFLQVEAAGGIVLLVCTVLALVLANSQLGDAYLAFWSTQVGFTLGGFEMIHSLKHWINDGLMAVFFFVIGLEVKRELVLGELRDPKRAILPIAAALGGHSRAVSPGSAAGAYPWPPTSRSWWAAWRSWDAACRRCCGYSCCRSPSWTTSARSWSSPLDTRRT